MITKIIYYIFYRRVLKQNKKKESEQAEFSRQKNRFQFHQSNALQTSICVRYKLSKAKANAEAATRPRLTTAEQK